MVSIYKNNIFFCSVPGMEGFPRHKNFPQCFLYLHLGKIEEKEMEKRKSTTNLWAMWCLSPKRRCENRKYWNGYIKPAGQNELKLKTTGNSCQNTYITRGAILAEGYKFNISNAS